VPFKKSTQKPVKLCPYRPDGRAARRGGGGRIFVFVDHVLVDRQINQFMDVLVRYVWQNVARFLRALQSRKSSSRTSACATSERKAPSSILNFGTDWSAACVCSARHSDRGRYPRRSVHRDPARAIWCSPPYEAMTVAAYRRALLCRSVRRFFSTFGVNQLPNRLDDAVCVSVVCRPCRVCRAWR
jgi:hypothetical protein